MKTVADMHQRKSEMAKNADAFIALPGLYITIFSLSLKYAYMSLIVYILIKVLNCVLGGYGTMEELLEMVTWSQLGIHGKPVR